MQVILLQRVEKLGFMGDTVTVRPGYARNYLLPQKIALRASKDNVEFFNNQRAQLEATNIKRKEEAQAIAKRMDNVIVTIIKQASESGQLYGSIRPRDVSDLLALQGYIISKNQVEIEAPIKTLGIHSIKVSLHPEVSIFVKANIALSEEEAVVQLAATEVKAPKAKEAEDKPVE